MTQQIKPFESRPSMWSFNINLSGVASWFFLALALLSLDHPHFWKLLGVAGVMAVLALIPRRGEDSY